MNVDFTHRVLFYRKIADKLLLYGSLAASVLILYQIGFNSDLLLESRIDGYIAGSFYAFAIILVIRNLLSFIVARSLKIASYSELVLVVYFSTVAILRYKAIIPHWLDLGTAFWLYMGIFLLFLVEFSKSTLFFDQFYINPAVLFVLSFTLLVLLGTVFLLFPKSTNGGALKFVDALFMSTSAVCITGLSVIDVSEKLTHFGQTVLLVLMQLGGLGMMTFTGVLGYVFSGGFSYKNQVMFAQLLGENKASSIARILFKIILITFFFEFIGIAIIYFSVNPSNFHSGGEQLFFAVFHGVSAFCNAGFSTVKDGLHNELFRYNYSFHWIIAFLIILGGMGFGIVFNVYTFIKRKVISLVRKVLMKPAISRKPWVINFNSRIIFWSSLILIVFGTVFFFCTEYNRSLAEHETLWGKFSTAFFMGITPRSGGFNTVDMQFISMPVMMVIMLLMWIGAAPGSTGGGIKVTTFVVALLNVISVVKGKNEITVLGREIKGESVRRVLAIIMLSLLLLGISISVLCLTDGMLGIRKIAFEAFSAYSTVGLSLNGTHEFSSAGRLVLIFTMFTGRVGALTILAMIIKPGRSKNYRYPSEEIAL